MAAMAANEKPMSASAYRQWQLSANGENNQ
jgi:hypothetical protein